MLVRGMLVGERRKDETIVHVNKIKAGRNLKRCRRGERGYTIEPLNDGRLPRVPIDTGRMFHCWTVRTKKLLCYLC